jgi:hypothetical protein
MYSQLLVVEYRALEAELQEKLQQLQLMRESAELQREMKFESTLRALMQEYNFTDSAVLNIIRRESTPQPVKKVAGLKKAANSGGEVERTFMNPHTGERVTVRRINHLTIRNWVDRYGKETVMSWQQP